MEKIVVLITAPSEEEAANIAYTLVAEKLAACANIVEGIRSIYSWQGEIHDEPECLMVVKTSAENFDALEARVKELHSYEVPEIIALPILKGSTEYLDWVWENSRRG
ncbi:MAG: divalent-cation tolerance protein CutA [Nitrospirae bacterium]|nr:divalent-cation tolerance protein CutA [Nitrospirota bacterium]MBI5695877.1 divalent-cation tolerance protein CutA [Nitrospirota bacterium]